MGSEVLCEVEIIGGAVNGDRGSVGDDGPGQTERCNPSLKRESHAQTKPAKRLRTDLSKDCGDGVSVYQQSSSTAADGRAENSQRIPECAEADTGRNQKAYTNVEGSAAPTRPAGTAATSASAPVGLAGQMFQQPLSLSLKAAFSTPSEAVEASKMICQASLANTAAAAARAQSLAQSLPCYSPSKSLHPSPVGPSPFQSPHVQQQHSQRQLQHQQQYQAALLQGQGNNISSFAGTKNLGSPVLPNQQQSQMQRQSSASSAFASPPASPHWRSLLQVPTGLSAMSTLQVKPAAAKDRSSCMPPPPPYAHGAALTMGHGNQLQAAAPGAMRTPVLHSLPLVTAALASCPAPVVTQPLLYSHAPAWQSKVQPAPPVVSARLCDLEGLAGHPEAAAYAAALRGATRAAGVAGGLGGVGLGGLRVEVPQRGVAAAMGVPASPLCSPSVTHVTAGIAGVVSPSGMAWGAPLGMRYQGVPAAVGAGLHHLGVQQQGLAAAAVEPLPVAEQCFALEQVSSTTVNAASAAMDRGELENEVTAPAPRNGVAEAVAAGHASLEGQGESVGELNRGAGYLVKQEPGSASAAGACASPAELGQLQQGPAADLGQKVKAEVRAAAERARSNHSRGSSGNLAYMASAATAAGMPLGGSPSLAQGVVCGNRCATAAEPAAPGVRPAAGLLISAAAADGECLNICEHAAAVADGREDDGGLAVAAVVQAAAPSPSPAASTAAAGATDMIGAAFGMADVQGAGTPPPAAALLDNANPAMAATALNTAAAGMLEMQFLEKCEKSIAALRYQQAKAIAEIKEQWAVKAAALAMELAKAQEEVSHMLAAVRKEADLQVAELKHELEVGLSELQARKGSAVNPMASMYDAS